MLGGEQIGESQKPLGREERMSGKPVSKRDYLTVEAGTETFGIGMKPTRDRESVNSHVLPSPDRAIGISAMRG
ncbi:MAG: hypothetical protein NVSMB5_13660 [Candidatus Velthaea sp.]